MNFSLNLNSKRARRARQIEAINQPALQWSMNLLALSLLFLGGFLLNNLKSNLGYLVFIPAAIWLIVLLYGYFAKLNNPTSAPSETEITEWLDIELLAKLKVAESSSMLDAIAKTLGGRFLATRFAISVTTIRHLLEPSGGGDLNLALQKSYQLAQEEGLSYIPSLYLEVAFLDQVEPSLRAQVLASINLDDTDIKRSLEWFNNFTALLGSLKSKSTDSGGLGRDLSFGYTPLLDRFAHNISAGIGGAGSPFRQLVANQQALDQLNHLLSSGSKLNAAIVGGEGIGKTNLIWNMAKGFLFPDKNTPSALKFKQVFELSSSTLISTAGSQPGALENLIIRIFNEAAKAKNIIIFLDQANLFLEDGVGKVNLSGLLQQIVATSPVPLILALTPDDWLKLDQSLASSLNRINLEEPDLDQTLTAVEDQVLLLEGQYKVTYLYQSLTRALDLASRFINDTQNPGKTIRLLELSAAYAQDGWVGAEAVELAIEKNMGVKVQTTSKLNNQDQAEKLLSLEDHIHQRMVNQTEAVKAVSDALRRAQAGVRNTNKPIGTFLFIGPTGVGKTELSKSLAEVYFKDESNLIRIDMNEFSDSGSVGRLLAPAKESSTSLTAQISKQPFSVVLLDELEKAHPNILNLLLQMLDEGVLRDSTNKEVSFKESIIIATSNAGASFIVDFITNNSALADANGDTLGVSKTTTLQEVLVTKLIEDQIFKPEFLNRFDEIITFTPLSKEHLKEVVGKILAGLNRALALQKLQVKLNDAAIDLLVEAGNDPAMGARPMRRIIQKTVENIIAAKILRSEATPGTTIELTELDIQAELR